MSLAPSPWRSGGSNQPNIVLDNLLVENSESIVFDTGGDTILAGSSGSLYFNSWASGLPVSFPAEQAGRRDAASLNPAPDKPQSLLDGSGRYFTRSKPQYEDVAAGSIVVATSHGVSISTTEDQTAAINSLLSSNVGSVIFFPAGVYLVKGTMVVPTGSKIVGSAWSQIMGTGPYFEDASKPKVMVQVGNKGDSGVIEISDMLFTVKGPTAGCILMEWNVRESSQGSAGMWDSHFRVGGAAGSDLQLANCPTGSGVNKKCMAAFMLMHMTKQSSGYFDNVWLWVADHDLDNAQNADATETGDGIPVNVKTDVSHLRRTRAADRIPRPHPGCTARPASTPRCTITRLMAPPTSTSATCRPRRPTTSPSPTPWSHTRPGRCSPATRPLAIVSTTLAAAPGRYVSSIRPTF